VGSDGNGDDDDGGGVAGVEENGRMEHHLHPLLALEKNLGGLKWRKQKKWCWRVNGDDDCKNFQLLPCFYTRKLEIRHVTFHKLMFN